MNELFKKIRTNMPVNNDQDLENKLELLSTEIVGKWWIKTE